MRRVTIRTLTPGPAVVEAAVSSRDLPLRCSPHKSAAVMGLPGRRLSQHQITTQLHTHTHTHAIGGITTTQVMVQMYIAWFPSLPCFFSTYNNARKQKSGEKGLRAFIM